jgi:cell division protein FtsB
MKSLSLKQILILFVSFLLLLAGYSALFGDYGYVALKKTERRSLGYNERIEQLKKENQEIRSEIRGLKKDPAAIEKIAREELGYMKVDEIKMTPAKQLDDPSKLPAKPDSHP